MPSLMNVPITRLVKNPRLSLTTIGVFLICLARSSDRYSASSLGLLALDDLQQRHLVHRAEEVQPDEVGRAGDALGQVGDRQGRGVRAQQRVRRRGAARSPAKTCALTAGSSKTASITRSAPAAAAGVGRRGDPRQQRVALLLGRAAALDGLVDEVLRVALAALGGLLGDVLEHDLDADLRADVRDRRAHHARRRARRPSWPGRARCPPGRPRSPLTCCRSKKNAWIMFFATWPVTRSTK